MLVSRIKHESSTRAIDIGTYIISLCVVVFILKTVKT